MCSINIILIPHCVCRSVHVNISRTGGNGLESYEGVDFVPKFFKETQLRNWQAEVWPPPVKKPRLAPDLSSLMTELTVNLSVRHI